MVFHTALNQNFHRHTRPYFLFLATLPEPRVEFANAGLQGPKLDPTDQPAALHQALIFAATKHRVEYLLSLLTVAGYALSLSRLRFFGPGSPYASDRQIPTGQHKRPCRKRMCGIEHRMWSIKTFLKVLAFVGA